MPELPPRTYFRAGGDRVDDKRVSFRLVASSSTPRRSRPAGIQPETASRAGERRFDATESELAPLRGGIWSIS